MNEQSDGIIEFGFSFDGVKKGVPEMVSLVDEAVASVSASMSRLNATSASGMGGGLMGMAAGAGALETGLAGAEARAGRLLTSLDRMSSLLTNQLGIGATVGGFALLERTFTTALSKAREFQTAQISIAAELSSVGRRTDAQGATVSPAMGFTSNLRYAQDLQARLLRQSAQNHLKFQEQLGAFQSALEPGVRKGLSVEQVFNISNLGAMAAKSLGLRGEQIANASRLLLGGGVNVARSTIGRALGLQNEDITSRSGTQLSDFLTKKLKGFQEAQGEFGQSIEGVISTLESRVDVLLSKVGMRFFDKIKPTLQGLFAGSEEPVYQGGAGHTNETYAEYQKRVQTYMKASEQQNETIDALATGFNNLFKALMEIINSGAFQEFTKFLAFLAQYTDKILLGAVFIRIANAIKGASEEAATLAMSLRDVAAAETMVNNNAGGGMFTGTGSYGAGITRGNRRVAGGIGTADALEAGLTASLGQQAIKKEVEEAYAARLKSLAPWASGSMLGNAPADLMTMAALEQRPSSAKGRERQRLARNKALMAAQAEEPEMAAQSAMVAAAAQADMDRLMAAKQAELEMRLGQQAPGEKEQRQLAARREARQRAAHQSDLEYLGAQQPGLQGVIKDETKSEAERLAAMEQFRTNEQAMARSTAFLESTSPLGKLRGNLQSLGQQIAIGTTSYAATVANKAMVGSLAIMGGAMLSETAQGWSGPGGTLGRIGGNVISGGGLGYTFGTGKFGIGGGLAAGAGLGLDQEFVDKMGGQTGWNAKGLASAGTGALEGGGLGLMLGSNFGPVGAAAGAGIGAVGGAILNPLIRSMNEAAEAAKMAAHALDDMKQKFPHGAEMSDVNARYRAAQTAIRGQVAGGMSASWGMEQMGSLATWRAREQKRIQTENEADKNYKAYWSNLEQQMAGTKQMLDNLEYSSVSTKSLQRIHLEAESSHEKLQKEWHSATGQGDLATPIPVQQDDMIKAALARKYGFKSWDAATKSTGGGATELQSGKPLAAAEEAWRVKYYTSLGNQVDTRAQYQTGAFHAEQGGMLSGGPLQEQTKKVYDSIGEALKTASENTDEGRQIVQQAINKLWDDFGQQIKSLRVEGLQQAAQQYSQGVKEETFFHNLPYERAKIGLEPEKRGEEVEKHRLQGLELGFKPQELALETGGLDLADQEAQIQAKERELKRTELARREQQLNAVQPEESARAGIEASNAAGAETLFYGGMGPISKVAAAIRFKVESEYAGRFNPAEYEAAYRQKIENEIEDLRITKSEAGRKQQMLPAEQEAQRSQIGIEWAEANQADLEAAHAAKERALRRAKLPMEQEEATEAGKEYATQGKELTDNLGETANFLHVFNESILETIKGFQATDAEMKLAAENLARQNKDLAGGIGTLSKETLKQGIHPALLAGNPLANPEAVKNLHEHERAMAHGAEHAQVSMVKEHKRHMAHAQSHTHTPEGHAGLGDGMTVNVGPITIGGAPASEQVSTSLKAAIRAGIEDWCESNKRKSKS